MKRILSVRANLESAARASEPSRAAGSATTTFAAKAPKNAELATFLKAKRGALDPRACKIKVTARRRARGLLREEVAQIAGISVTWYTWLEQGRPMSPSPAVLEALAGALRLTPSERRHLFRLARPDLDARKPSTLTTRLTPAIEAFLANLEPHPAYAVNGAWDVLAENEAARATFGSFFEGRCEPNVLARLFLDPAWRALFVDHDKLIETAVAQFRATTATRMKEPAVRALIASLTQKSNAFATLWKRGGVAELPAWRKTLRHPKRGVLRFDYATLHPDSEAEDVRISVYVPADARIRKA